jgi:anthranilate synthase component 1
MTDFTGAVSPDLAAFRDLARDRRVIPVVRRLLADGLTAIGLFEVLCGDRAGTFLLESAEQGRTWSRYSFVGVHCAAMLTEVDGAAVWLGRAPVGVPQEGSALEVLRDTVAMLRTSPLPDLPPLTGGLVGYLTYDAVRAWERVPDGNPDTLGIPDMGFLLATDLAVLDHADGSVLLIANAINYDATDERVDEAWRDAVARLDRMQEQLAAPMELGVATYDRSAAVRAESSTSTEEFLTQVAAAQEYIRAGDAFQIVLSQRYSVPCAASARDVYRVLRATNPSPYMYLVRMPAIDDVSASGSWPRELPNRVGFEIVGSSPEALVTVQGRHCVLHPIAGTRRRGSNPEEDVALAEELSADIKERAEHVMLVDLARNDLGRVCTPGSVSVVEFMSVERYSHVMHLVSTVTGELADDHVAYDVLAAAFPAGTLSGAPKPRAMAIIDELEPLRRGLYGGCVGYFDFAGNLDAAIAIRTALIKDGRAHVQAGAGIVADSLPQSEADECANKAAAVLRAVASAETLSSRS